MNTFFRHTALACCVAFVCALSSCYKIGHEHESHVPAQFDIYLHQENNHDNNVRDSVCPMYCDTFYSAAGVQFEFRLTSGNPVGDSVTCDITPTSAGISFTPSSFTFGLSAWLQTYVTMYKKLPGTYYAKLTVKSKTYGTEIHYVKIVLR